MQLRELSLLKVSLVMMLRFMAGVHWPKNFLAGKVWATFFLFFCLRINFLSQLSFLFLLQFFVFKRSFIRLIIVLIRDIFIQTFFIKEIFNSTFKQCDLSVFNLNSFVHNGFEQVNIM